MNGTTTIAVTMYLGATGSPISMTTSKFQGSRVRNLFQDPLGGAIPDSSAVPFLLIPPYSLYLIAASVGKSYSR
jgi:hypothetical protein